MMRKILIFCCFLVFQVNLFHGQINDNFESLKKYSVKADGKSDDTDAIQKAIDFCESNSIKTLLIPDGKYLLKKPLVFRKGGLQIIGTGALLREESWAKQFSRNFDNDQPFMGCTFLVPKNSTGFLFEKTVADPIRISNIQFFAQNGRTVGNTIGIKFASEFQGPTWPFIVERCNFRGFNYAVKFESENQYNIAFVQFYQNAFSQNDECVYFADLPDSKITNIGIRNLSWGFTFEDNVCHDNSRVIRGTFAKDAVNIRNNNMEGNIPYANNTKPPYIVDIEISNSTVNFEGNHFEVVISDCVSISSAFKKKDGTYFDYSGRTTGSEGNKVFIKGNNFDGVDSKLKPFTLKGVGVYNTDMSKLYVDECDIRQNDSNNLNLYLSDYALKNGTTIKSMTGKYESTSLTLDYFGNMKMVQAKNSGQAGNLLSPFNQLRFLKINKSVPTFGNDSESLSLSGSDKIAGATFIVNNPNASAFLGQIAFDISYDNGKTFQRNTVLGTYGTNVGFTTITGFYPLNPSGKNAVVKASLITNIIGDNYIFVADKYSLFAIKKSDLVFAVPYYK